ncbi:MAG: hypothetical protein HS111_07675 [Kofleriaceae bacterium]|nr:hypothetical protein [Kofleriaceae bacterium]MCL4224670.1 hypothetical protein [Myxococcales bacterium]
MRALTRSRGARLAMVAAAGAGATALALGVPSCGGGDPVCGDGVVEGTEQCDDGDDDETDECRACVAFIPPRTVVKWEFNAMAAPGFTADGCIDVGASRVRIELSRPQAGPVPDAQEVGCSMRQVTYSELAAGTYTAALTPLDSDGQSLVTAPVSAEVAANTVYNTVTETLIVVPPTAWARPMTGTFFYLLRWGGVDCAAAAPPVATQTVTLTVNGTVVAQQANVGSTVYPVYRLDGSQPVTCVLSTPSLAEAARMVPFGHATLAVSGRDSGGTEWFRHTFETFVGAGVSNPILTFDVPSIIDAGVDAPTDAPTDAAIDGGVEDAAVDAAPDA